MALTSRYHVSLVESPEVNFRKLSQSHTDLSEVKGSNEPVTSQSHNRHDLIERLEKRYAGGGIKRASKTVTSSTMSSDDDYYDSADSFIDDEELHETIEAERAGKKLKTKYTGFFVNSGNNIETTWHSDEEDDDDMSLDERPIGKSTVKIKKFIQDWSPAVSDWKPSPEIELALKELEDAAKEYFAKQKKPTKGKSFPRALDDALFKLDHMVVQRHPNKWRVNAYFARLMTFLPYHKGTLKASMIRLETKQLADEANRQLEDAYKAFQTQVEASDIDSSGNFVWSRDCRRLLYELVKALDNWVMQSNQYRCTLKPTDKVGIPQIESMELNVRQEKNKMYKKVLSFFPDNTMDLREIRTKYKMEADKHRKLDASTKLKGISKEGNTKEGNTKEGNTKEGNTKEGNTKEGNLKDEVKESSSSSSNNSKISNVGKSLAKTVKRLLIKSRTFDQVPKFNPIDFVAQPLIRK